MVTENDFFPATDVCPTYCTSCTRAHAVGASTSSVKKLSFKPSRGRFNEIFAYIEATPQLQDIVVSGGDCYSLQPEQLQAIGERLLGIPHIKRFRFASRGLAVAPVRIVDPNDGWAAALADVSRKARTAGKLVAFHTHFNHPDEISWVTEEAAQRLFEAGVIVRNQTVLLRGVNDDVATMSALIRRLADNKIFPVSSIAVFSVFFFFCFLFPFSLILCQLTLTQKDTLTHACQYYVYLCDMVKRNEHMRTSLQTMLDMETQIRGSIAGFMMPQFVVDLPGGGGKRLGSTYTSYDRKTGISRFVAPAVTSASAIGKKSKPEVFEYYDPVGTDGMDPPWQWAT